MNSQFPANLLEPHTDLLSHAPKIPCFSFNAQNRSAAQAWQESARTHLASMVGFLDDARVPFNVEEIFDEDRAGIRHRKIHISTGAASRMPVHLLYPASYPHHKGMVIAYEGHGYGVNDIVGIWEDGTFRTEVDGYQKDFALELCRRGFLVATPETAGFGERQNNYSQLDYSLGQEAPSTCHHVALFAIMLRKSLLGLRLRDCMRLLDFVQQELVSPSDKIGAMGISGGGMLTLFHAALDSRISASVVSGYFSSFEASVLSVFHCPCNYVPGLSHDFEMVDIGTLILPRRLLVEAGTRDPIFPIGAVRSAFAKLEDHAKVLGANESLELDLFEGRHRIGGRRCYDFLAESLAH